MIPAHGTAPPVPQPATVRLINRHYSQFPSTESLENGMATKIVIYPKGIPPQKDPAESAVEQKQERLR